MINHTNYPAKIILRMYNTSVTTEWDSSDVGPEAMIDAFLSMMVCQGFHEETIKQIISQKAEDINNEEDSN